MSSSTPTQAPVLSLREWGEVEWPGHTLNEGDRSLVSTLGKGGQERLFIDELRDGLRVTATSWAGVVRLSRFEVRVHPKLVGGEKGLVRLIDYAYGLDALKSLEAQHTLEADDRSLFDLICLLFAQSCDRLLRRGLRRDYQEQEEDLPVLRGRLLVREQALKRMGRLDRLECRFDEHTTDNPDNRLLLFAASVCSARVQDADVSLRLRRLSSVFAEECRFDPAEVLSTRQSIVYDRLNEHYREAHVLANLILDGLGVRDLYAGGSVRAFSFLLDMNLLFEKFIERWVTQLTAPHGVAVHPQRRDRSILWNATTDRPYKGIIPDLLIERRGIGRRRLPLDAKYKLYDERSVDGADLYQMFLYAFAYGASAPDGLILYPASKRDRRDVKVQVRNADAGALARLTAMSVDVPAALQEARTGTSGPQTLRLLGVLIAKLDGPADELKQADPAGSLPSISSDPSVI